MGATHKLARKTQQCLLLGSNVSSRKEHTDFLRKASELERMISEHDHMTDDLFEGTSLDVLGNLDNLLSRDEEANMSEEEDDPPEVSQRGRGMSLLGNLHRESEKFDSNLTESEATTEEAELDNEVPDMAGSGTDLSNVPSSSTSTIDDQDKLISVDSEDLAIAANSLPSFAPNISRMIERSLEDELKDGDQHDLEPRIENTKEAYVLQSIPQGVQTSFKCKEGKCSRVFKVKEYFIQHVLSHRNKKYSCEVCGTKFTTKAAFKTHSNNMHTLKLCNSCPY